MLHLGDGPVQMIVLDGHDEQVRRGGFFGAHHGNRVAPAVDDDAVALQLFVPGTACNEADALRVHVVEDAAVGRPEGPGADDGDVFNGRVHGCLGDFFSIVEGRRGLVSLRAFFAPGLRFAAATFSISLSSRITFLSSANRTLFLGRSSMSWMSM